MAKIRIPSFLFLLIICASFIPHLADDTPRVTFILGDSTADVGTNDYLPGSNQIANVPHNGVDFPHQRPTGRFSNGLNGADFVAKLFGLKRSPPPFLFLLTLASHHFRKHLFKGVNFASGGSGLLDITNKMNVVPLSEQIAQFSSVRDNFTAMIGAPKTEEMLGKSLFFISTGNNDIIGYFQSNSSMPKDKFISILISVYSKHITTLYGLGARKVGIINVLPLGCCPRFRLQELQVNGTDDCYPPMNDFAQAFNSALHTLLRNMSSQLPRMKYSLGNIYQMTFLFFQTVVAFDNVVSACCGNGTLNAEGLCRPTASVCPDRRTYLFWDRYHPTQEAAKQAAQILYSGPPYYVSPINFAQLAQDD